jgi:hypothetical protein
MFGINTAYIIKTKLHEQKAFLRIRDTFQISKTNKNCNYKYRITSTLLKICMEFVCD